MLSKAKTWARHLATWARQPATWARHPPTWARHPPKALIRALILFYQRILSPLLHFGAGPAAGCRFEPSCSNYFLQAVETHGVIRGCGYGIWRILRCHPWGGSGYDPVPQGKDATHKTCDCHGGTSSRH